MNTKEYYQANREKYIQYSRDYYAKHSAERQEYAHLHYEANKERRLAYQAEYYRKRKAANPSYTKEGTPPRSKTPRIRERKPKKPVKNVKPKLIPEPRKEKYEFPEASFEISFA
jgi:hypothetical protein